MAGGHMKHRHLGRTSSHRQALLRNLVTSLFTHESISTTWPKAKEAQRLAEKVVTLAKRDTNASRRQAERIFYNPLLILPHIFSTIKDRYATRPGGYTRVLRIEPLKEDQAPSAILELVDGPKDMRFHMTAKTLVRERLGLSSASASTSSSNPSAGAAADGRSMMTRGNANMTPAVIAAATAENEGIRDITLKNVDKVTRFRPGGQEALERLVKRMEAEVRRGDKEREKEARRNRGGAGSAGGRRTAREAESDEDVDEEEMEEEVEDESESGKRRDRWRWKGLGIARDGYYGQVAKRRVYPKSSSGMESGS
ncbi:hypothetical protein MMC25_006922 [Agyrium rufum]|nr:hypothetical protein [Agyrium rufum]